MVPIIYGASTKEPSSSPDFQRVREEDEPTACFAIVVRGHLVATRSSSDRARPLTGSGGSVLGRIHHTQRLMQNPSATFLILSQNPTVSWCRRVRHQGCLGLVWTALVPNSVRRRGFLALLCASVSQPCPFLRGGSVANQEKFHSRTVWSKPPLARVC